MNSTPIIDILGLHYSYPGGVKALEHLDFTTHAGELIGIIGNNGSGKSTLLKLLAGSLLPSQGSVSIFQQNPAKSRAPLKQKIGYIEQNTALDPDMTGLETLKFFAALYGLSRKPGQKRINEIIESFDLSDFIKRRVKSYSGGQKKRLHIACGLLHQPELLILDEPGTALDPKGKRFLWRFLKQYTEQGGTVLIVDHDLDSLQKHCSRIILLESGAKIADNNPNELINLFNAPVLELKPQQKIKNQNLLVTLFNDLLAVDNIDFQQDAILLEPAKNSTNKDFLFHAVQILTDVQIPVNECRWRQNDLAHAYFKLTGHVMTPTNNRPKGDKKRD